MAGELWKARMANGENKKFIFRSSGLQLAFSFTISSVSNFTLRQGDVVAKLSQICYRPDEGFQEDNTWYVAEGSISAESDTKLVNGPATLVYDGTEFPVGVTVFECETECETLPGEEREPARFEIAFAEGLPKLAHALRLL